MIRNILSVVAGYMIFAMTSVLLFNLAAQDPHADASLQFKLLTIAWGIIFSILAGWIAQLTAKQKTLNINYILATLIFTFAGISLFMSKGCHWTQLFAMFIFAPASILGGLLMLKRRKSGDLIN